MKRLLIGVLLALPSFAGDPWETPRSQWTQQDAPRILNASPWAKPDGRTKAIVRWDSARPVQLAIEKLNGKPAIGGHASRSEEHTSELQSRQYLVCRLLLEKKKKK